MPCSSRISNRSIRSAPPSRVTCSGLRPSKRDCGVRHQRAASSGGNRIAKRFAMAGGGAVRCPATTTRSRGALRPTTVRRPPFGTSRCMPTPSSARIRSASRTRPGSVSSVPTRDGATSRPLRVRRRSSRAVSVIRSFMVRHPSVGSAQRHPETDRHLIIAPNRIYPVLESPLDRSSSRSAAACLLARFAVCASAIAGAGLIPPARSPTSNALPSSVKSSLALHSSP